MDISGLIRVDSIAYEYMMKMQLDRSSLLKVFAYLVDGWRDLNLYHISNLVFQKKTLDKNSMLSFPNDALLINQIFVAKDGEMKPLSRKNSLVRTTSLVDGNLTRNGVDGENEPVLVDTMGLNAEPSNPYGFYSINNRDRTILFLTDETEVIVAYTTSGLSGYDTLIPVAYKHVLLSYVRWQYSLDNKESMNMTMVYKDAYTDSILMMRDMLSDYSLYDIASAMISNTQIPGR